MKRTVWVKAVHVIEIDIEDDEELDLNDRVMDGIQDELGSDIDIDGWGFDDEKSTD